MSSRAETIFRLLGKHTDLDNRTRALAWSADGTPVAKRIAVQHSRIRPIAPVPVPATVGQRVVALGGGTGLPTVLRSVRRLLGPASSITAIVTVTDDGGSSGQLREELGMLPPGDARNCLAALANETAPLTRLMQHRLTGSPSLDGHAIGNLMLAALTQQMDGDFASALDALGRIVGINGRVLPATSQPARLRAEFECGLVVEGETAIAAVRKPIKRLSMDRRVRPVPEAMQALLNADVIIVGPGSLYTSILPILLVDGIGPTIYGLKATRICVANLMTEPGETEHYSLEDHLDAIDRHVGLPLFDYVLANDARIPHDPLVKYARNCSHPVRRRSTQQRHGSAQIIERDLAWVIDEGKLRHDRDRLATALGDIMTCNVAEEFVVPQA